MSTWFITGASRGFGLEIARQALERGHKVVATARKPQDVQDALSPYKDSLLAVALDVTDEAQAREAVEAAVGKFGRIDVLVNNAGRGVLCHHPPTSTPGGGQSVGSGADPPQAAPARECHGGRGRLRDDRRPDIQ
jgi:NAD(P)-dependent dehydrogenase (short-subunit alcohol dehydrogenase family)